MKPLPLVAAVVGALYLLIRRRSQGRLWLAVGSLAVVACLLVGFGVVVVPDLGKVIENVGTALGSYTYVLVGLLAFLETGAFIGLIAPGETAVIVGGVVAGQGQIDPIGLIALVWACAVAGDLTSYWIGRRLGRDFLLRHGSRLQITEARLVKVEEFLDKRGGSTILIGRFIGLVRALAPFIAGTARMPLRTFVPYDVLGAGLWSGLFVTLGYVFWRSFDTVTAYVGRGLFLFVALVALIVAGVYVRRLIHDEQERERAQAWIETQAARPGIKPVADRLRPVYRRVILPAAKRVSGPARFAYGRLTPGDLGLELTTLLAVAVVGGFGFALLTTSLGPTRPLLLGDEHAADLARALAVRHVQDVVAVLTDVGSIPVTALITLVTAAWLSGRSRAAEGIALVVALALTWITVAIAKAAEARPRPINGLVDVSGLSFPSGHSAYAISLLACAIVLVRAGSGFALRFAAVTVASVVVIGVGVSRIYLRAHYLSDVLGGFAIGAAIFALCGIVALIVTFVRQTPSP